MLPNLSHLFLVQNLIFMLLIFIIGRMNGQGALKLWKTTQSKVQSQMLLDGWRMVGVKHFFTIHYRWWQITLLTTRESILLCKRQAIWLGISCVVTSVKCWTLYFHYHHHRLAPSSSSSSSAIMIAFCARVAIPSILTNISALWLPTSTMSWVASPTDEQQMVARSASVWVARC